MAMEFSAMEFLPTGHIAGLQRLYDQAKGQGGLLPTDIYTVRDLLELSDYVDREPLHALLLAMLLALDEGSLCVAASEEGLTRRLTDLIGEEDARAWARRILAELRGPGYPALIGAEAEDGKPIVLHRVGGRECLYFQKYLRHEATLRDGLQARLTGGSRMPLRGDPRTVLKEVLVDHPLCLDGRPVQLNRDQRLAVALALLRNFVIISGGPGTGKTSVVFTLLRCLIRSGIDPARIALAAPTGRAAQRLTDAVRASLASLTGSSSPDGALKDLAAQTLHHLLRYRPSRGSFGYHVENPLPADVVIVDEVSMVGLELMDALLQATPPETRLILLGDKDQLPSVEAGALLAYLVPESGGPHYSVELGGILRDLLPDVDLGAAIERQPLQDVLIVLQENYRSQKDIQEIAQAINQQDASVVDRLPRFLPGAAPSSFFELDQRGGCWMHELAADGLAGWRRLLEAWAEHQYFSPRSGGATYQELVARCRVSEPSDASPEERALLDQLFGLLGQARILTLLREGPWGSAGVNRHLEQRLRPRLDRRGPEGLFAGAPVLIARNDYRRGLFNGDVGIVLRSATDTYRAIFQRADGYLSLPLEALPAHDLAFALTVHKSQGSEYGQVLLALPAEGGRRLLTKELIYTAVTRAKQLVVISGTTQTLRTAIGRRIERESALLGQIRRPDEGTGEPWPAAD